MSDEPIRHETELSDAPAPAESLFQPLLAQLAGEGAEPVSLTLDYGRPLQAGLPVMVEAWIERATRSLIFAHARLVSRADGSVLVSGSAVFRRAAQAAGAA
jgi:acyl-coenzyme A thioesterase PaaI-like protein